MTIVHARVISPFRLGVPPLAQRLLVPEHPTRTTRSAGGLMHYIKRIVRSGSRRCLCLASLLLEPPSTADRIPGPGADVLAVVVGVFVTVAAFALGIGYWLWRRDPLRCADVDVRALAGGDSGWSSPESSGEHRMLDRQQRGEHYGQGFPSQRPGAADTGR